MAKSLKQAMCEMASPLLEAMEDECTSDEEEIDIAAARREMKEASRIAIEFGFWPSSACRRDRQTPFANLEVLAQAWNVLEEIVGTSDEVNILIDTSLQGVIADRRSENSSATTPAVSPKRPTSMRTRTVRPSRNHFTTPQIKEATRQSRSTVSKLPSHMPLDTTSCCKELEDSMSRVGESSTVSVLNDDSEERIMERESSQARSYNALNAMYCSLEDDNLGDTTSHFHRCESSIVRAYESLESPRSKSATAHANVLPPVVPPTNMRSPKPFRMLTSAMVMDLGLGSSIKAIQTPRQLYSAHQSFDGVAKRWHSLQTSYDRVRNSVQKPSVTLPSLSGHPGRTKMEMWKLDDLTSRKCFDATQLAF